MSKEHGYWGPATATIDWCERNYAITFYVAEFWNTVSNVLFLVFGVTGLYLSIKYRFEQRFHVLYVFMMLVGVGSAMFHASLQLFHQHLDETPMVLSMLLWAFVLYEEDILKYPALAIWFKPFLATYGLLFAVIHWHTRMNTAFQVHFMVLVGLCMTKVIANYRRCDDTVAKRVCITYFSSLLIGCTIWFIDFHFCHAIEALPINPQGHAWWHLIMGFNATVGAVFIQYVRARQLGMRPIMRQRWGVPYVVTLKLD